MRPLLTQSRQWRLHRSPGWAGWLSTVVVWLAALLVTAVFLWIAGELFWRGASEFSVEFFTTGPADFGLAGGILPVLVSTAGILLVALVVAVPLGTACAVWLSEFTRRGGLPAALVPRSLDVLAATPSIVFGLFGNALFCNLMGMGYSILAGGLTLACMVLPVLIRSLQTSLQNVPHDYRLAAASLGISRTQTTLKILLPSASRGLVAGLILGASRVLSETAALLFTSGDVDRMPRSLMDSGRSLPVHIYDLALLPGGESRAYASAAVLLTIMLLLNLASLFIADRWLSVQTVNVAK